MKYSLLLHKILYLGFMLSNVVNLVRIGKDLSVGTFIWLFVLIFHHAILMIMVTTPDDDDGGSE